MAPLRLIKGDSRQLEVQNFHRLSDKLNVSLSVNPRDLACITCPEQHAFVLPDSAGTPVCLNLSDQFFSPYIPAEIGKRCIGCVRVEDAKLADLERYSGKCSGATLELQVTSPGGA